MNAKKIAGLVVIAFLGFWMFTDPNGLAATSKTVATEGWSIATQLFTGVIDFVGALG